MAELLHFSLGHTMTFDCLQYDDWDSINRWCRETIEEMERWRHSDDVSDSELTIASVRAKDRLRNLIMRMLPHYGTEWANLGYPSCAEQWYAEKYGEEKPYQFRHKPTGSIVTVMAKHALTAASQCSIGHWVEDETLPECLDTTNFDEDWEAIYG
jgi:hypothetical protein